MIKKHKVNATETMNNLNDKLKRFYDILESTKTGVDDSYLRAIMMTYTPFEWEQIAITIAHYQLAKRELTQLKDEEKIKRWYIVNTSLIGYMSDMVNMWFDRLPGIGNEA